MKNLINILLPNKKIIFYIILILVLISISFIIGKNRSHPVVSNTAVSPIVQYVDKENNNRSIIESSLVAEKQLKEELENYKKLMKDKDAKIKSLTILINKIDTSFKSDTSTRGNFFIQKNDENIQLTVKKDSSDEQATISLKIIDSLYQVSYTTNRWWKLERTKHKIDIKHTNKLVKTPQAKSLELIEKRPIISLGIQTGYSPFTNSMYLGIGVQVNIFSIKIK